MSNQQFFNVPFALSGDQTSIPQPSQPSGSVSFTDGWGYDYQRDQATDPAALPIDRSTMNWLFNSITAALGALQSETFPEWIPASQTSGSQLAYGQGATVLYSSTGNAPWTKYVSLINNNTDIPGATSNWQVVVDVKASSAMAAAGTDNDSIMTPLLVAQQDALRALLAGNSSQVFNVGPATASTHAVQLQQVAALGAPAPGFFSNLKLSASGSSAIINFSFNTAVLSDGSGNYLTDTAASGTINSAGTGAGGLDTGTLAASTFYSVWRIATPSGTKSTLLSLSATSPTMPSGFTLKARMGWIRTDGTANKYPLGYTQDFDYVSLAVGSGNVSTPPQMASGAAGTITNTSYVPVAVSTANYVPTTASRIRVGFGTTGTGQYGAASANPTRSGWNSQNPPEIGVDSNSVPAVTYGDIQLESSNIYWASTASGVALLCTGWKDNL